MDPPSKNGVLAQESGLNSHNGLSTENGDSQKTNSVTVNDAPIGG